MKSSEVKNLIKKLGGPKVVAAQLRKPDGAPPSSQAISHWKHVPTQYCPAIERMARERGVTRSDGTPYTCALLRPEIDWGQASPEAHEKS